MDISTKHSSNDMIDAIRSDLEAFVSLWTALRKSYEGTSITKTVAQLLHMYQPEDGVLAYERLLKTLIVLLEDFDTHGLRLLVSMVSPPIGASEETITKVFHESTGFVRINAPLFHQSAIAVDSMLKLEASEKDKNCTLQSTVQITSNNFPASNLHTPKHSFKYSNNSNMQNTNSPQLVYQDHEVFRGFPVNEISTTQSRMENLNSFHKISKYDCTYFNTERNPKAYSNSIDSLPLPQNVRLQWVKTPFTRRESNTYEIPNESIILKTMDNKLIRIPHNKLSNICSSDIPQVFYQDTSSMTKVYPDNLSEDNHNKWEDFNRIKRNESNLKATMKYLQNDEHSQKNNSSLVDVIYETTEEPSKCYEIELKINYQQIQNDIDKMDFVRVDEDNQDLNPTTQVLEMDDLKIGDELRNSLENYLNRTRKNICLDIPKFPPTRSLSLQLSCTPTTNDSLQHDATDKIVQTETHSDTSKLEMANSENERLVCPEKNMKNFKNVKRKRNIVSKKLPQKERIPLETLKMNQDPRIIKTHPMINSPDENLFHRYLITDSNPNVTNFLVQDESSSPRSSLYKKQYYDALLNFQKNQEASNSSGVSPVGYSMEYDPYYSNYLYQHHIMHPRQHIMMGAQTIPSTIQSGLASSQNVSSNWTRPICNDWRYSPISQFRLQQMHNFPSSSLYASSQSDYTRQNARGKNIIPEIEEHATGVRCKTFENIVGELKSTAPS